ncbi:MAG: hypothetical protein SCALA702_17740 [Melioribacteraceae bacterium]|nr:MAG: hypothetical protein SCALA702_17740 [Melioribacteraceae bacterium]
MKMRFFAWPFSAHGAGDTVGEVLEPQAPVIQGQVIKTFFTYYNIFAIPCILYNNHNFLALKKVIKILHLN